MIEVNQVLRLLDEEPLRGKYDYPIWEIKNFDLPELNFNIGKLIDGHEFRYELEIVNNEPSEIDKFMDSWQKNINEILDHVKASDLPILDQMWKGGINDLGINKHIQLMCDKPGLHMGQHIDNRHIVGVLIINLKDNDAGTYIDELDFKGPTEKGTGMFILNNYNTSHSIHVPHGSEQNRHIGYHTLQYEDFEHIKNRGRKN